MRIFNNLDRIVKIDCTYTNCTMSYVHTPEHTRLAPPRQLVSASEISSHNKINSVTEETHVHFNTSASGVWSRDKWFMSSMAFICDICEKQFPQKRNLVRHKESIHYGSSFTCERCGDAFNRKDALKCLMKKHSQEKLHQCQYCSRKFYRRDTCLEHQKLCAFEKEDDHHDSIKRKYPEGKENGEQRAKQWRWDDATVNTTTEGNDVHSGEDTGCSENPCALTTAMKHSLKTFKLKPQIQEKNDLSRLLYANKASLVNRLSQDLKTNRGLKWFISVQVKLFKPKADGSDEISEPHFRSLCMTTVNVHEIEEQLNEVNQKILSPFTSYQKEGSGWMLSEILHIDLSVAQYKLLKGSSYLPLPKTLKDKKAIINIENKDNKCFMWSVLAALHPVPYRSNT